MTTVASSTAAPAAAAPAAATDADQTQLAGNFDTFLTLLTTQLQNQDPLNPMDSNQFTQQLVEFSQVEQQINTNTNLQTLITQGSSQTGAYAVSYLGKAVTVTNGNAPLSSGAADWNYNLGTEATQTTLTVTNASGAVVYTGAGETGAGAHTFNWDGTDGNGGTMQPDGTYKLTVSAAAGDGTAVTSQVSTTGVVSEVDMTSGTPQLLVGPMSVPLADVSGVQNL
jgi:flagellar basal-body rod modification protein FlgD